jgi:MFS family permease
VGLIIFGFISDKIVKHMSAKGEMKPEYRLPPLIPGSLIIPIGLFLYGWSAEKHVHWIVPIIGTLFVGFGLLATFMPIQTYLVDAFTIHAASAIAASTVLRSLVGTFLPLAGPKLYAALGLGWGNSLLGFIAVALAPLSWIFFKYGERIRKSSRFQVNF